MINNENNLVAAFNTSLIDFHWSAHKKKFFYIFIYLLQNVAWFKHDWF